MKIEEWQKGNESSLTSLERLQLHNEWLKKIHADLQEQIKKSNPTKESEILLGGFDD